MVKNLSTRQDQESMILHKLPGYFLILGLLLSIIALIYLLSPFLTVIVVAAVLTVSFYGMYRKFLNLFRGRARLASLVSCLIVILVIVVPLTVFTILVGAEAVSTYQVIEAKINSGVFDEYLIWDEGGFFYDLKNSLAPFLDISELNIKQEIITVAKTLSETLLAQATNIITGIISVVFGFVIMLFAMYYFFKDGPTLVKRMGLLSPLPSYYEKQLFDRLGTMVKAIVFGVFFTSLAQGFLGGVGFAIAGISNPMFWGAAMAFMSLAPMVGTALIWAPAAVILAILGNYGAAVFIIVWGVLLVGSIDNVLRPYLIGGKAHTYPLMTFFVVLGGVFTMGLKGVIVGPLVLMLLLSFLHIYEAEYQKVLKK